LVIDTAKDAIKSHEFNVFSLDQNAIPEHMPLIVHGIDPECPE